MSSCALLDVIGERASPSRHLDGSPLSARANSWLRRQRRHMSETCIRAAVAWACAQHCKSSAPSMAT